MSESCGEQQVEIPAEGLLLASQKRAQQVGYAGLDALTRKIPAAAKELREEVEVLLQAAAPSIRQQERERLKEQVQPALDAARSLAERVNQELGDYPAYSSAEDAIQEAEAALATLKEEDHG